MWQNKENFFYLWWKKNPDWNDSIKEISQRTNGWYLGFTILSGDKWQWKELSLCNNEATTTKKNNFNLFFGSIPYIYHFFSIYTCDRNYQSIDIMIVIQNNLLLVGGNHTKLSICHFVPIVKKKTVEQQNKTKQKWKIVRL